MVVENPFVQNSSEKSDKLKGTILIFAYAWFLFALIESVPGFFGTFTMGGSYSFLGTSMRIIWTTLGGALGGLIFYFAYEPAIHPIATKIPFIGKSIFRLFFVPAVLVWAVFGPIMLLWTSVFAVLLTTFTFGAGLGISIYFIIYAILSIIFSLIGSYVLAKTLDSKLKQYYIW
jgi:hypothetical protein